jgi:putative membrane protein
MWLTVGAGGLMVYQRSVLEPWLHIKLGLVGALFVYHLISGNIRRQQRARNSTWSSRGLRMWNEVATVLLVAIVFLAVKKDTLSMWGAVGGLVALGVVLMLGLRIYRALRGA